MGSETTPLRLPKVDLSGAQQSPEAYGCFEAVCTKLPPELRRAAVRVLQERFPAAVDNIGLEGVCSSLWFAANPSKRWGEAFILLCTPFWVFLMLGIIVPFRLYERFAELEYLLVGLISALPYGLIPLVLVGKADNGKHWKDRYWVKANLWIMIFSYVGNYFLTHYFFTVLGASYTFPSWTMNNVPHATFLLAHCCFLFYHVTSNIMLRRVRHSISHLPYTTRMITEAAWTLALAYFIAYLETLAISNFPYYDFVDRASMYKTGSLFYAMYFIVSFPMFLRVDERSEDPWDLKRVAVDALGAAMLVTIILDLWRLFLGPIVPIPESKQRCIQPGLVWFGGGAPERNLVPTGA